MKTQWIAAGCAVLGTAHIVLAGPYHPAAGQTGTTAIHKDNSSFVDWATGYSNYTVGADVDGTWQTPSLAFGKAKGDSFDIVSLGNGGQITLTFDKAITNGEGFDFAVFENSFSDGFLELAWVEVSSDGNTFVRFTNDSKTASAVSAFGVVDPTNIDGLAGKYRQGYGTPFDLQLLAATPGLDVNAITHVRLIDIVGDGTALDSSGDIIYDPHKTTGSGGFDLDAVGVINQVPEPATLSMLSVAACCLCRRSRR